MAVYSKIIKSSGSALGVVECLCSGVRFVDTVMTMDRMVKNHRSELDCCSEAAGMLFSHLIAYGSDMPDDMLNQYLRAYRKITQKGFENGRKRINAIRTYGRQQKISENG